MAVYFADLHIHIGFTDSGKPVKMSASKHLTLSRLLHAAREEKGLHMVGVIDTHVPEVMDRLKRDLMEGASRELPGGGIDYQGLTLILGSEVEVKEEGRKAFHLLSFMPTLEKMERFSRELSREMKNITLSSQRYYRSARELQALTKALGGLFVPAHIFTPHKGILSATEQLSTLLDLQQIDAVELGLSGDTEMADHLPELRALPFLTNSDAHSTQKIAREYQKLLLHRPDFLHLSLALQRKEGNQILANYGLNPSLGKYHRSKCSGCGLLVIPYQQRCPQCGKEVAKGVYDRILELGEAESIHPDWRPPYYAQILLEYFPGVGAKRAAQLIHAFGNEMNLLHYAPIEEIGEKGGEPLARMIELSRNNQLHLIAGGGGTYGKIDASG